MLFRIFDRYLGKQVFSATAMGVLLLSGVMVLGNVYKKLDQLLGGAELPMIKVIEFVGLIIPFSLIFTIPWAFLTAILLVFGRLSADNELVSLRMTGMSMFRICASVFAMAVVLSGICFWVNVSLAPMAKNRMKFLFYEVVLENKAALFQEGRVLEKVPGIRVYTGGRKGDELTDLHLVELNGDQPQRIIHAKKATLESIPDSLDFVLHLSEAQVQILKYGPDGKVLEKIEMPSLSETALTFPMSRLREDTVRINASMKTTDALWQEVKSHVDSVTNLPMDDKTHSSSLTELSKRYSFSLACFTFALVGVPLGVTAQRRETAMGFALSLMTATAYLVFIILADSLNANPKAMPHLIMWAPNILFLGVGGMLFWRLSKK